MLNYNDITNLLTTATHGVVASAFLALKSEFKGITSCTSGTLLSAQDGTRVMLYKGGVIEVTPPPE